MVGVLIVAGIIGYGIVYSGLSHLPNPVVTPPQSTLEALTGGKLGAGPKGFPKPTDSVGVGGSRTGATGTPR